jgi:dTDP-4-amino-4,6-dideoxygalactose transaminase
VDGATYSHFPVRVPDRAAAVRLFLEAGIHVGEVIEYSVPHLTGYATRVDPAKFPNSRVCGDHLINLPVHPSLSSRDRQRVVDRMSEIAA